MNRTVVDPARAIDAAIRDELKAIETQGHELCRLPDLVQMHRMRHEPGAVPKGLARAVCAVIRGKGFQVRTATARQVAEAALAGADGVTFGWIPPEAYTAIRQPFTVLVSQELSPMTKLGVLCHEAGHVLLGHPPANRWEAEAVLRERDGNREDDDQEVAAELGRAAIFRTAGLPVVTSHHYLAHHEVGTKGIEGARRFARMLWPAVEQSLN